MSYGSKVQIERKKENTNQLLRHGTQVTENTGYTLKLNERGVAVQKAGAH